MIGLGLGVGVQLVADTVVGVRLLALARRTRKLPELCFGTCVLLLGTVGLPLSIAARAGLASDPEVAGALLAIALTAQNLAVAALTVGTWKVFRPSAPWAAGLVGLAVVLLVGSIAGQGVTLGFRGGVDGGSWYWAGFAARALAFVWAAAESIRFFRMMRRRERLGLVDPVVTDRFGLWAISCLAVLCGFAVFLAGRLHGLNPATSPAIVGTCSAAGVVAGVCLWLAFAPPRAYVRRAAVRRVRRAATGASALAPFETRRPAG